jgi:hypothetical protein
MAHKKVYGICENKCFVDLDELNLGGDATNSASFTYVIDSNEALADYANSVSGNDYTSVLIKKGTWSINISKNIASYNTKLIYFEDGAKIVINSDGATDSVMWQGNSTRMFNGDFELNYSGNSKTFIGLGSFDELVNCKISVKITGSITGYGSCFNACKNLKNCRITSLSFSNSIPIFYGFNLCHRLFNCDIDVWLTASNCGSFILFNECISLNDCRCERSGLGTIGCELKGFVNCKVLSNCRVSVSDQKHPLYGFENCEKMAQCNFYCYNITDSTCFGFYQCKHLYDCIVEEIKTSTYGMITTTAEDGSEITKTVYVDGFAQCESLFGCRVDIMNSTLIANADEDSVPPRGFIACKILIGCYFGTTNLSNVQAFIGCSAVLFCSASSVAKNKHYHCLESLIDPSDGSTLITPDSIYNDI